VGLQAAFPQDRGNSYGVTGASTDGPSIDRQSLRDWQPSARSRSIKTSVTGY
jgi:hypothetical protein